MTGGGSGNWCGTSVEFQLVRTGVGASVEIRFLWLVVEVGCAMERRGRFVRGVSGN